MTGDTWRGDQREERAGERVRFQGKFIARAWSGGPGKPRKKCTVDNAQSRIGEI